MFIDGDLFLDGDRDCWLGDKAGLSILGLIFNAFLFKRSFFDTFNFGV